MAISQMLIPKRAINFHKKRKVKENHVFGNLVLQESKTCNWASRYRHQQWSLGTSMDGCGVCGT